jgi:hypothetical protein
MLADDLQELMSSVLVPLGCSSEPGDELREPPLELLSYYTRSVRISALPILGRGLSVVALVRQPIDISIANYERLMERVAKVINTRFPPVRGGRGLTLGFTTVVTTPEPIQPEDDASLEKVLSITNVRNRAVPLGVFRVNLGQEAVSFSLRRGPENLFPEPDALADALSIRLRRFAKLMEF